MCRSISTLCAETYAHIVHYLHHICDEDNAYACEHEFNKNFWLLLLQ